jgi:hypothetical protein
MNLIEVFDRLCGKRVSRIDFKQGAPLVCPRPALVDYADSDGDGGHPDMWIEASEDGLLLHFNAEDQHGEMRGQTEALNNITRVIGA